MNSQRAERGGRDRTALVFIVLATAGYSLLPLVVALGGGTESPFYFNAGLTFGMIVGTTPFLLFAYGGLLRHRSVLAAIGKRTISWSILFMAIKNFEFAFFAWSTKFVDISITAILYETWPILLILLTAWLYRDESRYKQSSLSFWMLLVFGFIGVAFVVLSQSGTDQGLGSLNFVALILGIVFALTGAGLASLNAFGFKWGTDLSDHLTREHPYASSKYSLDLFGSVLANFLASIVVVPVNLFAGFSLGETLAWETFSIAMLGGIFCLSVAMLFWRYANLITHNLGINAIGYATPVLSLFWLFLFSQAEVARVDYLIIGAASIITTNLLINFKAEIKMGFKSLILAMWACGAFVYLRDELLRFLPVDTWLIPGEAYLGALGLAATVFTLVLSFRVARLAERTQEEDNLIFVLFQNLEILVVRKLIDPSVREHILTIDGSHSPDELGTAYNGAKDCFDRAVVADLAEDDRIRLAEAEAQLNSVVHSRRHGIDVGELFALMSFGGITVMLAMLGRPPYLSGWGAFLFEAFASTFSAVIVFLMVSVWDLHDDRTSHILEKRSDGESYGVAIRDFRNRTFEQITSTITGLAIAAAYLGLLWGKWLV